MSYVLATSERFYSDLMFVNESSEAFEMIEDINIPIEYLKISAIDLEREELHWLN